MPLTPKAPSSSPSYKFKLTAVALANKLARIVFALLARGGVYEGRPARA